VGATVWKGQLSFGMVCFPVKLTAAARGETIGFHQLHQCDHSRVRQVLYCQAEDRPIARSELVKGFEYAKDRYVVLDEADLARAEPRTARVLEVLEFVPAAEVDPVYLCTSYYVAPEPAARKPYTLLPAALRRRGHVAVAQWTAHSREHLVLIRPGGCGLVLHTLYYPDEVRAADEFRADTCEPAARELELACLLVDALAARFEPGKYHDRYRERLRAVIEAKVRGQELETGAAEPPAGRVMDILAALQASLARSNQPRDGARTVPLPPACQTGATARKRRRRRAAAAS
jgi:DNA end-binding protein Ku